MHAAVLRLAFLRPEPPIALIGLTAQNRGAHRTDGAGVGRQQKCEP